MSIMTMVIMTFPGECQHAVHGRRTIMQCPDIIMRCCLVDAIFVVAQLPYQETIMNSPMFSRAARRMKQSISLPSRRDSVLLNQRILCVVEARQPPPQDHVLASCRPSSIRNKRVRKNSIYSYFQQSSSTSRMNTRCMSTNGVPDTAADMSVRVDFWGEPVTFISSTSCGESDVEGAVSAMDDFSIAIVSKGGSCSGGGDDEGVPTMAAHSVAIVWAECLRQAALWHESAPMLAVAAVGPLLIQANVGYLQTLDSLLAHADSGIQAPVSLIAIAKTAVAMKDDERLTFREQAHLKALYHMLRHERREALVIFLRLLQQAPGDALALCLAIDLAGAVGDRKAALRAAGFVASYWQERGDRGLRPSMPGYSLALSWIALGFAAGGRFIDAERLAERAIYQDAKTCGPVATWAFSHVYDAEGRTAEAISKLAGDGVKYYEEGGLSFFDGRLASYGARFLLDREGHGEGRSSLRMYDTAFDRVLQYSGYANGNPWSQPQRRTPRTRREVMKESAKSFLGQVFRGRNEETVEDVMRHEQIQGKATLEDVLAWMSPTPQLLTDASFLLLRLTVNGSVLPSDQRWAELTKAWTTSLSSMLDQHNIYDEGPDSARLSHTAIIAASLMCPPIALPHSEGRVFLLSRAFSLFGQLLRSDSSQPADETKKAWAEVVKLLSEASSSTDDFEGWDIELRPAIDQAICFAACKSQDAESLCIARSFNSLGVSLRPNCPEEWYRYSIVLEALGDDVAAEDARAASVSLGAGEGGAGVH